jgi:hypothetical protein
MSHSQLHFYDSANANNVPTGVHAAAYVNGFKWAQAEIDRMKAIFRVSVKPESVWAEFARAIDVETDAANPDDVVPFVVRRRERHNDATVYVNRSNWPIVVEKVHEAGIAQPFYWVATLDGTKIIPESERPRGLVPWAVQYFGGADTAFDLSVLFGVNNFVRP